MLTFSEEELADARRFYHRLTKLPKIDFNKWWWAALINGSTRLASLRGAKTRGGRKVETIRAGTRRLPIRLRVMRPDDEPKAIIFDLHGGGWASCSASTNDSANAKLAEAGYLVVSADYPFAPRTSLVDVIGHCLAAARWVIDAKDPIFASKPIFLQGDSGGAHLTASVALRLKEDAHARARILGMVLFYGCYDLGATESVRNATANELIQYGPTLPQYFRKVTGGLEIAQRRVPEISPLFGDMVNMPPALLLVGDNDALIDDSTLLAERLRQAGVPTQLEIVPEAPHSFDRFPTKVADKSRIFVRDWMDSTLGSYEGGGV